MGVQRPSRKDAAAFQLAAVLEDLDIEVARLELNPRSRTLLTSGREHVEKARGLCSELGIPAAATADLDESLRFLQRQIGHAEIAKLAARMAEVRQVTAAIREVCIAILAKSARL